MNIEFHQNAIVYKSLLHYVMSNNVFEQCGLTIIEYEEGLSNLNNAYITHDNLLYFDWICMCNIREGYLLANKFNNNICTNYNLSFDTLT
jgi:hypothetical protein